MVDFVVSRSSDWGDSKPCEEAVKKFVTRCDEREGEIFSDFFKKIWHESGYNHRVENGNIKRDITKEHWVVELNSLEDILNFHKKYGQIIIKSTDFLNGVQEIEIYDYYRE
jgi:hypothetical protein